MLDSLPIGYWLYSGIVIILVLSKHFLFRSKKFLNYASQKLPRLFFIEPFIHRIAQIILISLPIFAFWIEGEQFIAKLNVFTLLLLVVFDIICVIKKNFRETLASSFQISFISV